MRIPLSPRGSSLENKNSHSSQRGRVSSLRSAWENGLSPIVSKACSPERQTVLPSAVRSQERSIANQSWRSAAGGQENNSVAIPAWRSAQSTAGKERSPIKQGWRASSPTTAAGGQKSNSATVIKDRSPAKQGWRSSPSTTAVGDQESNSSVAVPAWRLAQSTVVKNRSPKGWRSPASPFTKQEIERSTGIRHNSPRKIASPSAASKELSAYSIGHIRKWQTIGSPDAADVYQSRKESISSSDKSIEVYQSEMEKDSPTHLNLQMSSDSMEEEIPDIVTAETADSPAMNMLRNELNTLSLLDDTSAFNGQTKHQAVLPVKVERNEDENSFHFSEHNIIACSSSSSSLVYSIEDTIPSHQSSRKSKEAISGVVQHDLQQIKLTGSESTDDSEENKFSAELIASDLIASTLAECRLLLQMSPPPTPFTLNSSAKQKTVEMRDAIVRKDSGKAIKAALSPDSTAVDSSVADLMRCHCCSQKFEESGIREPLHSFACDHIVCKGCVFSTERYATSVPCPECGEKGAFDKTRPLVSRSYLNLIKKMGCSGSSKYYGRSEDVDEIGSVPSLIRVGSKKSDDLDAISVFSSVSGHMHASKLAAHHKELARQIDEEKTSVFSNASRSQLPSVESSFTIASRSQLPSVESSFTINPQKEDVGSDMSVSQSSNKYLPSKNSYESRLEVKSLISVAQPFNDSSKSEKAGTRDSCDNTSGQAKVMPTNGDEISSKPPQEPATPVSRAEYRFLQRKQRVADSLQRVNLILEKAKNKQMGKFCEGTDSASIASRRTNMIEKVSRDQDEARAEDEVSTYFAASTGLVSKPTMEIIRDDDVEDQVKANLDKRESKIRLKPDLRVDTGPQPSPLPVSKAVMEVQSEEVSSCQSIESKNDESNEPIDPFTSILPVFDAVKEDIQSKKSTNSESDKLFDPFRCDSFGEDAFTNVFRGDDIPVADFSNSFTVANSFDSSMKENVGTFLLPFECKIKSADEIQKSCSQFLPSLDCSKNEDFVASPSVSSKSGKSRHKIVKKKKQQHCIGSFEEASNASGFGNKSTSGNILTLYEFSEPSCSLSPSSEKDTDLVGLVTRKKGFSLKVRSKMRKTGSKKH